VVPPPGIIMISGGYTLMGIFGPSFSPTNQIQVADEISWSHGKHTIRAGYEFETCVGPSPGPAFAGFC